MAFHPYAVRPIGSDQFERYLKDLFTSQKYYMYSEPESKEDLKSLAVYGTKIWKSDHEFDPYESLLLAVITQAILDYLHAYRKMRLAQQREDQKGETIYHNSMLLLENYYFRENEFNEMVFEYLLNILRDDENHYNNSLIKCKSAESMLCVIKRREYKK